MLLECVTNNIRFSGTVYIAAVAVVMAFTFIFDTPTAVAQSHYSGGTFRPSTHPMWAAGALGPDFFALNKAGKGAKLKTKYTLTQLHVALDFGYHFSGDGKGPAIGATIEQSFGQDLYTLNPGFKFWWDIPITDKSIYLAPFAKAGYLLGASSGNTGHGFNLGFGAEGRLVIKDRWMALLRLPQIDLAMGDFFSESVVFNVTMLAGGGVTF